MRYVNSYLNYDSFFLYAIIYFTDHLFHNEASLLAMK